MPTLSHFLLTGLLVAASTSAFAGATAGKYTKVYSGSDGLTATVVDATWNGQKGKVVVINGTSSSIDDIPLFHTEEPFHKGVGLQTIIGDTYLWTITSKDSRWGGKNVDITLPEDVRKKYWVYYNESKSNAATGKKVIERFNKATKSAAWHKVQLYSGSNQKGETKGTFKRAVNDAKKSCSAPIGAVIDWSGFTDANKKSLPVASLCRIPADVLANLCSDNKAPKNAGSLKRITCAMGKTESLKSDGKSGLTWTLSPTTMVNREKIAKQLNDLLSK